jgi:hypothetical protein
MSECLAAVEREQIGSRCPVVDHEVVVSAPGSPDDLSVWCICRTEEEKRLFRHTEHVRFVAALKKKMVAAGFPDSAIASLTTRITSRPEVEKGGGRFFSR